MADVVQSVLFTVGTMGGRQGAASMAAMAAKIGLVAGAAGAAATKIKEMVDDAQAFGQVLRSVETDMSAFNKQTGGLVGTMDALQGAIRLQEGRNGEPLAANQMAAIGVAATDMAQKLGEGPEGATRRFNQLVKAITTGRQTALKEFGIEIKSTSDLVKFQSEAIEQLTEKYGDLSVSAETATEQIYAFNNSFETVRDANIDAAVGSINNSFAELAITIFGGVDAWAEYENAIIATQGEIVTWEYTMEGFAANLQKHFGKIANSVAFFNGQIGTALKLVNFFYGEDIENMGQAAFDNKVKQITTQQQIARDKAAAASVVPFEPALGLVDIDLITKSKPRGGSRRTPDVTTASLFDPTATSGVDPLSMSLLDDLDGS
jgi:phage-related protein